MITIIQYMTFIIIYSFCGWVIESISKSIEERQLVNSGFLNGPICPIYGLGAMIMIFVLGNLKDKIILLFLAAFVLLTIWEYVVGIFLEKVFKTKYWDYSDFKFNFQGRICLKNSIYWGVLGVIFIQFIHPFVSNIVNIIPTISLTYVITIIYSILVVDIAFSISTYTNMEATMQKINEMGENIKLKLEELKQSKNLQSEEVNHENMEKIIHELKRKQLRMKIRFYKQIKRIKMAFPTMKSESMTKILNQKVDFETLKNIMKKEK